MRDGGYSFRFPLALRAGKRNLCRQLLIQHALREYRFCTPRQAPLPSQWKRKLSISIIEH
jgi:hypothetical protein